MMFARNWLRRLHEMSLFGKAAFSLFVAGFIVGPIVRVVPWHFWYVSRPIPESVDVDTYLSAMLGGLAVFIAILTGFLAAAVPLAAESLSVKFVSHLNRGMVFYLAMWVLTACVTLFEFIHRPKVLGELWHLLFWFVALVVLMFAQLEKMPSQLSGESMSRWSLEGLRKTSIDEWESSEHFRAIPVGLAQASARFDILTVRAMSRDVAQFLVTGALTGASTPRASQNTDVYRTLKTLLTDSMVQMRDAPSEAAYSVGRLAAGILVHASVTDNLVNRRSNGNTFDRLALGFGDRQDLAIAFWAGARHALFGHGDQSKAAGGTLIAQYWQAHPHADEGDLGQCQRLSTGIATFVEECAHAVGQIDRRNRPRDSYEQMGNTALRFIREYLPRELETEQQELAIILHEKTGVAIRSRSAQSLELA